MKYQVSYKGWKGYGRSEEPSATGEAIIEVKSDADTGRARSVALNTLDKYAREHDRRYARTTSQVLSVEPVIS